MTIIDDHSGSFNLSQYYDNLPFIIANGWLFTITLLSFIVIMSVFAWHG